MQLSFQEMSAATIINQQREGAEEEPSREDMWERSLT